MNSSRTWFAIVGLAVGPAACGAKSQLRVIEAGVEASVPIMVQTVCPAPISVMQNVAVTLTAHTTVTAPATITSETWSVVNAPAGAMDSLVPPTGEITQFTGDTVGAYTVRHVAVDSQGDDASCETIVNVTAPRTSMGTEFWAVSTTNSGLDPRFHFAVAIGNPNTHPVDVTIDGGALTSTVSFTVPARETVTRTLPWVNDLANLMPNNMGSMGSASVSGGAYRIRTTAPVTAFQFNPLEFHAGDAYSYTNDASLLLPTAALTGSYRVLGHNAQSGDGAFVAIVGTNAATTHVTVTPRAPTLASNGGTTVVDALSANTPHTFALERGDVLQLISTATDGSWACNTYMNGCDAVEDFTGSTVEADQPIAVFSGNDCADIGTQGNCPACDHLEQQLFPRETWGRNAVVSQFRDRASATEPSLTRVLSASAGNTVTFNPPSVHAPVTLGDGEFVELCAMIDFEITSTGPILVGQFMSGAAQVTCDTCTVGANVLGDPSFVLESPVAQYRHDYEFVVPTTYTRSVVNIAMHPNAPLLLDGLAPQINPDPIPGTNWVIVRMPIAPGSHVIETMDGQPFGLKVSGVAAYTSYAYPGGLDLGLIDLSLRP